MGSISTPKQPLVLDQLPKETFFENLDLYKWEGFWYRPKFLEATLSLHSHFEALDDDVFIASAMKTGTTWLKALCFSIIQKESYRDQLLLNNNIKGDQEGLDIHEDPLTKNPPAFFVKTLEIQVFTESPPPDLSVLKSPRLFHTHLPYSALPGCIKDSKSKIVYITRNPKDTIVSMWSFLNNLRSPEQGTYEFEKAFESFCEGVFHFGPFFEHVLEYWNESLKMPEKILFLKYEDLKRDPKREVKRLASFIGRPFDDKEGNEGMEEVIRRCSLERLKEVEVNKNGIDPWVGIKNSAFFRNGIVGGWKNVFTTEMSERLDQITLTKLEGSGLSFES